MTVNSMIVCGWYTPDYKHWTERLIASIDRVGHKHDFVMVDKAPGGWEANTLRKADQILAAMDRHPGRAIVFLDVDCEVRAPLHDLADIRADFAVHMMRSVKRNFKVLSGTLVFQPTQKARELAENWQSVGRTAPLGTVDQITLIKAMAITPSLTVMNLPETYCAISPDGDPAILHDHAAAAQPRVPRWRKRFHALRSRLVVEVSA